MLEALGEVALRRSDHVNALAYFSRALREFRVLGDGGAIAECLGDLAAVAAVEGDVVRAGRLIGAARAFREPGRSAESTLDSARLGALPQGVRGARRDGAGPPDAPRRARLGSRDAGGARGAEGEGLADGSAPDDRRAPKTATAR